MDLRPRLARESGRGRARRLAAFSHSYEEPAYYIPWRSPHELPNNNMEEITIQARLSCDSCTTARRKCSGPPAGLPDGGPCERCAKSSKPCHFSAQKKRGPPRRKPETEEARRKAERRRELIRQRRGRADETEFAGQGQRHPGGGGITRRRQQLAEHQVPNSETGSETDGSETGSPFSSEASFEQSLGFACLPGVAQLPSMTPHYTMHVPSLDMDSTFGTDMLAYHMNTNYTLFGGPTMPAENALSFGSVPLLGLAPEPSVGLAGLSELALGMDLDRFPSGDLGLGLYYEELAHWARDPGSEWGSRINSERVAA